MRTKHNCSEKFGPPSPPPATAKRRPGAPKGNRNAFKHGARTRELDELRAAARAHLRQTRALLKSVRALCLQREEERRRISRAAQALVALPQ